MSLKQEIETWVCALGQYDNHEFEEALKTFDRISDTSKILFNCGMIHATLGEHQRAVDCFQRAIRRDQYLAVAYFQQGVSNFLIGDFEEALANFNDTLLYLRGNRHINYEQLGLKYKLHSCEVLFNRGLCFVYLGQKETGMSDLKYAAKEKETPEHDVIDEAIQEGAEEFTVFSIGVGIVYRPNNAKVKNLKTKDYLGKARIIAAADQSHISGSDAKRAALQAAAGRSLEDRPPESISFAASNLVKPNLHSRSRQQSEPPIQRNLFPPTPPPENETEKLRPSIYAPAASGSGRAQSFSSTNSPDSRTTSSEHRSPPNNHPLRPEPLKLSQSSFTSLAEKEQQAPRPGTTRSASERPSQREPLQRDAGRERGQPPPRRLFREINPASPGEADIDEHPDEALYSPSLRDTTSPQSTHHRRTKSSFTGVSAREDRNSSHARHRSRSRTAAARRTQHSIEEEDETGEASTGSSMDEYEVLHNAGGGLSRPPLLPPQSKVGQGHAADGSVLPKTAYRPPRTQSERPSASTRRERSRSRTRIPYKPPGPPPSMPLPTTVGMELKNIRIKLHYQDDTRFVMLAPDTVFEAFVNKVMEKMKVPKDQNLKVKVRDEEGDLITVGDPDDWELALQSAKKEWEMELARREPGAGETGMGRMEVWVA